MVYSIFDTRFIHADPTRFAAPPNLTLPVEPGQHLWVDKTGWIGPKNQVHLMCVTDVGLHDIVWLRVYHQGGYYNVAADESNEEWTCWPTSWL